MADEAPLKTDPDVQQPEQASNSSQMPPPKPPAQSTTTSVTVTSQSQDGSTIQQYSSMDPAVALAHIELQKKLLDQSISIQNESWIKEYWRPAAGWLYMLICLMDFIGFPLLAMFLPEIMIHTGIKEAYVPWVPLTLSNGGMFHLAFGAILGVTAWQRGNEKIAKLNQ